MAERKYSNNGRLPALVEPTRPPRSKGGQIDWANVTYPYMTNTFEVKLNGAASAAATSLTVDPLPYALKKGARLYFGTGEPAIVTADAAAGATTVAVEALPTAVEDNDVSYQSKPGMVQEKFIPAFTEMARDANDKLIPRANRQNSEPATEILASDARENSRTAAADAYGSYTEGNFYEQLMPGADATTGLINSTYKTELIAAGFKFFKWSDDSVPA